MTRVKSKNIWDLVLAKLEVKVNGHSFKTWFRPTEFLEERDGHVRVKVPNAWFAEWLRTNYIGLIQDTLREVKRSDLTVQFCPVLSDASPPRRATTGKTPRPPANGDRQPTRNGEQRGGMSGDLRFNPRYTFDTFVVSSCNQFAHAAAMAVAEQPARNYNPLYIYGGVGLGKTHLMQAIGNHLAQRDGLRLRYISSEHFMNELINAIRFEKTYEFKEKYRKVDLLLVDDIQFLAGKERTQEEFFHTFNALHDGQKQIVITSDVTPREIPTLEERLRSRFEWGLIADIQPPDLETKVAILRKKAEAEGAKVPDDVALLIASNARSNIRELEGGLIRVVAYASMTGREIDIDLAKEILKDFLIPESPAVTVETIQRQVANHYKIKVSDLKAKNNSQQIALPRQIAMYLCRRHTDCSLPETGRRFGGKHHSTVIHAIQKIERKRREDKEFDRFIETLDAQLK